MGSRYLLAERHKVNKRTAGDLTLNSATWADLPTIGTSWDTAIQADVGDVLVATVSGLWGSEAVDGRLDVATIVSAAVVNYFSVAGTTPATKGVGSWHGASGAVLPIGGNIRYTVVAGDIASGLVTCRLRYSTSSAANKTLYANSTSVPLIFSVENIGPVDPH